MYTKVKPGLLEAILRLLLQELQRQLWDRQTTSTSSRLDESDKILASNLYFSSHNFQDKKKGLFFFSLRLLWSGEFYTSSCQTQDKQTVPRS